MKKGDLVKIKADGIHSHFGIIVDTFTEHAAILKVPCSEDRKTPEGLILLGISYLTVIAEYQPIRGWYCGRPVTSPARRKGGENMRTRNRRAKIWAYLDGKKLVEVIQAALDNNMMVDDMKALLIKDNPGHEVTFKVEH